MSINDKAIHIVEKSMSTDELIMIMYNSPARIVYDHFKAVNSHIKNNKVEVGQVVLLSPATSTVCTIEEAQFLDIALAVDKTLSELEVSERQILAKRFDLLSNIASYNGLFLGVSTTAWNAHTSQVKSILNDLERSYVNSYNSTGNLKNKNFLRTRNTYFQRLNTALNKFGQPTMGGNIVAGDIRNNLGLSSKSMIHQWGKQSGTVTNIPNFSKNFDTVAKMSRNLKRAGYISIALTGVDAVANIQKACAVGDDATCSKSKYTETGKASLSIAGGIGGGMVATWATCTLVFGLPTGGTSAFWCALVAGAGGGYVGGKYGGELGETIGEKVYISNGVL